MRFGLVSAAGGGGRGREKRGVEASRCSRQTPFHRGEPGGDGFGQTSPQNPRGVQKLGLTSARRLAKLTGDDEVTGTGRTWLSSGMFEFRYQKGPAPGESISSGGPFFRLGCKTGDAQNAGKTWFMPSGIGKRPKSWKEIHYQQSAFSSQLVVEEHSCTDQVFCSRRWKPTVCASSSPLVQTAGSRRRLEYAYDVLTADS